MALHTIASQVRHIKLPGSILFSLPNTTHLTATGSLGKSKKILKNGRNNGRHLKLSCHQVFLRFYE